MAATAALTLEECMIKSQLKIMRILPITNKCLNDIYDVNGALYSRVY